MTSNSKTAPLDSPRLSFCLTIRRMIIHFFEFRALNGVDITYQDNTRFFLRKFVYKKVLIFLSKFKKAYINRTDPRKKVRKKV